MEINFSVNGMNINKLFKEKIASTAPLHTVMLMYNLCIFEEPICTKHIICKTFRNCQKLLSVML